MNLEQVTVDIESWIQNFVEVPHPALGNFAPCPYARAARLRQSYEVRLGLDPHTDLAGLAQQGLGQREVIILVYDPSQWPRPQFAEIIVEANVTHLVPCDLLALEDHPHDPELVNGVCMNQGTYAMVLVQSLSDLNHKAKIMASKGFYHSWPEQYLDGLFQHRQDPRS